MTVSEIRHCISNYKNCKSGYTRELHRLYRKANVPDTELLLDYLEIIYGVNGKNADKLFYLLMKYKNACMATWAKHNFFGSTETSYQSEQLCELYSYETSEECISLMKDLGINCYSKILLLFSTMCNYYVLIDRKRVVKLSKQEYQYLLRLFGNDYIIPICNPIPADDVTLINIYTKLREMESVPRIIQVSDLLNTNDVKYLYLDMPDATHYTIQRYKQTFIITIFFKRAISEDDLKNTLWENDLDRIIYHHKELYPYRNNYTISYLQIQNNKIVLILTKK